MPIAVISDWIQSLPLCTYVRESELLYPFIMTAHLACIAFFGGLILLSDLRLLGLVFEDVPAPLLIARVRPLKRVGFVAMVIAGLLLATAKMNQYYSNPFFITKILLLAGTGIHALAFRRSVYGRGASAEGPQAKLAGALSLVLWIAILSLGRWIAYYEAPK